jgi:hypothetical protein
MLRKKERPDMREVPPHGVAPFVLAGHHLEADLVAVLDESTGDGDLEASALGTDPGVCGPETHAEDVVDAHGGAAALDGAEKGDGPVADDDPALVRRQRPCLRLGSVEDCLRDLPGPGMRQQKLVPVGPGLDQLAAEPHRRDRHPGLVREVPQLVDLA